MKRGTSAAYYRRGGKGVELTEEEGKHSANSEKEEKATFDHGPKIPRREVIEAKEKSFWKGEEIS